MVDDELLDEAPVTWFLSYRGAPLLLLPIRLTELIMDFPQEIPVNRNSHFTIPVTYQSFDLSIHQCCCVFGLTLEGTMLRAAWGYKIEGHMGCTTDILMRKSPTWALVASTHHTLADKISSPNHKDKQDDGNDWANGVRPSIRDATGGRRHIL